MTDATQLGFDFSPPVKAEPEDNPAKPSYELVRDRANRAAHARSGSPKTYEEWMIGRSND